MKLSELWQKWDDFTWEIERVRPSMKCSIGELLVVGGCVAAFVYFGYFKSMWARF